MTGARDTFRSDVQILAAAALLRAKGDAKAKAKVLAELVEVMAFAMAVIAKGNAAAASDLFESATAYLLERTTSNTGTVEELLRAGGKEQG